MLFRVRCPRCGQTAEIAEEHLGRQGQCNNCGSLVAIPARLSKICFVCGVDVTNIPHTKDENSNYICTNCYHTRQATPQGAASGRIECSICHVHFPREQSTGPADEPICPDCSTILQAHRLPVAIPVSHQPSPSATATIADAPPALEDLERIRPLPRPPTPQIHAAPAPANSASRLSLILSSLALIGVGILGILHFTTRKEPAVHNVQSSQPDNSDQQALTRVLILKSQAEVLIEVGKVREGIEKYDALLRIAPSTPTIAAELDSAKSEREKALKILAAATTQRASDEKPAAVSEPQRKPGTIFNE